MLPTFFLFLVLAANSISVNSASRETFIVHMNSQTVPTPFTSHQAWYSSILTSLVEEKEKVELLYTYTKASSGFSARLSMSQVEAIKNHPCFLSYARDTPLQLATSRSADFLGLNSISGAWPTTDLGRNTIIGVVDTGVWPESMSFNEDGMSDIPTRWKGGCYGGDSFNSSLCNKKIVGARFFNKGLKAAYPNRTVIDSARDFRGHGTHVAAIAAGNYVHGASYFGYAAGTIKGMAPRAHLAIYEVGSFHSDGPFQSDVLAAIDSAIQDGVDIISLSLGFDEAMDQDTVAISTFAAMEHGIFVSAAAGNSGSLKSTENGAPWVLTVAAGTLDRAFVGTVVLGNGAYVTGTSLYPLNKTVAPNLPVTYMKTCGGSSDIVDAEQTIGVCSAYDNETAIYFYGSRLAGGVLICNVSEASYLPDLPYEAVNFPYVVVSAEEGQIILDYISANQNTATATLWFKETSHGTKPAPKVADFSSRGPSKACPFVLKPDVMAPGNNILASWSEAAPLDLLIFDDDLSGSFNIKSGTSMASPHVAGVAALVKAAHPDWSPAAIKSAIMTTANRLDNTMGPIQEQGSKQIATPLAFGSGHINPNKALNPGLVYDASADDYVNLMCGMNFTTEQIQVITRSKRSCNSPSLDLNYPAFIAYFSCNGTKSVTFHRTLTNVGAEMSTYSAELSHMEPFNVTVIPQKLVFEKLGEKLNYMLKLDGPCLKEETIIHGSISWLETGGNGNVASPIVLVGMTPDIEMTQNVTG